MSGNEQFKHLCSPFQLRHLTLRNRIVKAGAAMNMSTDDGYVSEADLGFYETQAKGGAGLIIVPHGFIDYPMGVSGPRRIGMSDDKYIPGLTRLSGIMHKHGALCIQQLGHSGPQQTFFWEPGHTAVSASYVESTKARELTKTEIKELVTKWGQAALRAKKAGYDGVEVNSSARYLLNSFMSCSINKRTDEYGPQSLENRLRFTLEVMQAVREQVGKDYLVGVRINIIERGMDHGIEIEESKAFAKMLQDAGADYINTRIRGTGTFIYFTYPEQIQYPEPLTGFARDIKKNHYLLPFIAEIKKSVSIPVIAVGRMDARLGEWALETGKADLIGINRRMFADPYYPEKVCSGRMDEIAPCTACMHCWASQQSGGQIVCRINASLGQEYKLPIETAKNKKKIMVIGAGPGGMEAARVAALRGHDVTIYEKGSYPGGLLPLAAMIKGTEVEPIPEIVAYFRVQFNKLGVRVKLNTAVTGEMIDDIKPDAVVIASGGKITMPDIPGINTGKVVSNITLHKSAKFFLRFFKPGFLSWLTRLYIPFGRKVVIIGGLIHGLKMAEFLVKRGRQVTIAESSDQLGSGMHDINKNRLIPWLIQKGVVMFTGVKYKEITKKGLTIITKTGEEKMLEADSIAIATLPASDDTLFKSLKGKGKEAYIIGDAKESRTILDAIHEGFRVGREI